MAAHLSFFNTQRLTARSNSLKTQTYDRVCAQKSGLELLGIFMGLKSKVNIRNSVVEHQLVMSKLSFSLFKFSNTKTLKTDQDSFSLISQQTPCLLGQRMQFAFDKNFCVFSTSVNEPFGIRTFEIGGKMVFATSLLWVEVLRGYFRVCLCF